MRGKKKQKDPVGMNTSEIFAALAMLEKERGIPQTFMMEKIIQAITTAYKRDHDGVENVIVDVDEEHQTLKMYVQKNVVDEEDYVDPEFGVLDVLVTPTPAGTVYPYAGSTPIPLNPVDMPTPTPKPDLSFSYDKYIASTVGVTFEGPSGWQVNETQRSTFVLSEPTTQIKDGQQCIITISAENVGSTYKRSELETHVEYRLDSIGGSQFTEFKPSYTATRHMLGADGVYANYSGRLTDGTQVGGRIQYVCIDGVLYGLEIVFPEGFRGDFIDVFGQVRSSMNFIR